MPKRKTTKKKASPKKASPKKRKPAKKPKYKVYKTRQAAEVAKDRQAGTNRISAVTGGFRVTRTGKSRNKPSKK